MLTRKQWSGVIDFSHAVNAEIVSSFAISPGVRDANGVWTPIEAKKILAFTKKAGGSIVAAEMFNEPSFASMGGAPKGYDAAAYARDFRAFHSFIVQADPELKVLGPGAIGEGSSLGQAPGLHVIKSEDMLKDEGPGLDAFSYHFYGGVSKRCGMMGGASQSTPETALSDEWLSRTNRDAAFYSALRDRFAQACNSGSPKQARRHAAVIHGLRHLLTAFAISINSARLPGTASRLSFTTPLRRAITRSSMKSPLCHDQITGPRWCGAD